jgi:hypothetical protein
MGDKPLYLPFCFLVLPFYFYLFTFTFYLVKILSVPVPFHLSI